MDIRFIWMLDEMKAPSHATLCDFINQELSCSLEAIVQEINNLPKNTWISIMFILMGPSLNGNIHAWHGGS